MKQFLNACGINNPIIKPIPADASSRQYYRIIHKNNSYILMLANPKIHKITEFISIAKHLKSININAPEIYNSDTKNGLILLQDFGDNSFRILLKQQKIKPEKIYSAAIDIITSIHNNNNNCSINIPQYDNKTLINEAQLLTQWYTPNCSQNAKNDFSEILLEILQNLPPLKPCLVLRDYHIDNIIQIKNYSIEIHKPQQACGIIDFQDALIGSPAYDIMSILEDARINVPQNIQNTMIQKYLSQQKININQESFLIHYKVLATIRHAKVIGIFTRLAQRDNKKQYLKHIPRVITLLQKNINSIPELKRLRGITQKLIPNL